MRRSCVLLLLCTGAAEAALLLPRVSHATPDRTLYERATPLAGKAADLPLSARPQRPTEPRRAVARSLMSTSPSCGVWSLRVPRCSSSISSLSGLPLPERAAPAWRAARPHAVRAGPRCCSAMRQEHAALLSPHATPARTLFERLHDPRLVPTSEAQAMPVVRLPGD